MTAINGKAAGKTPRQTRGMLLQAAQKEIRGLLQQHKGGNLRKEKLKAGVKEVQKHMAAMPIHEDGSGGP